MSAGDSTSAEGCPRPALRPSARFPRAGHRPRQHTKPLPYTPPRRAWTARSAPHNIALGAPIPSSHCRQYCGGQSVWRHQRAVCGAAREAPPPSGTYRGLSVPSPPPSVISPHWPRRLGSNPVRPIPLLTSRSDPIRSSPSPSPSPSSSPIQSAPVQSNPTINPPPPGAVRPLQRAPVQPSPAQSSPAQATPIPSPSWRDSSHPTADVHSSSRCVSTHSTHIPGQWEHRGARRRREEGGEAGTAAVPARALLHGHLQGEEYTQLIGAGDTVSFVLSFVLELFFLCGFLGCAFMSSWVEGNGGTCGRAASSRAEKTRTKKKRCAPLVV